VGASLTAPVRTGPGAPPLSYTMSTGSFPGVKRPEPGVEYPSPSSTEVTPPLDLRGLFLGELFTFTKRHQSKDFIVPSFQTFSKLLLELSRDCTELPPPPFLFIFLNILSAYFHQTSNNDGEYISRVTTQNCYTSSLVRLLMFLSISVFDGSLTYITAKYCTCVA